MPKWIKAFLWLVLLSGPLSVQAGFAYNPVEKLARGVENLVTSPLELYYAWEGYAVDGDLLGGATIGTLYGVGFTVARIGTAVFDIVTFPFSINGYEPVFQPPRVLDYWKTVEM